MAETVPLVSEITIRYLKIAMGDVTAVATLVGDVDQIISEVRAGRRPEFLVRIELIDGAENNTGEMDISWTLKPQSTEA